MKDYEEKVLNIIERAKVNIIAQLNRAYKSGYEDGKKVLCDCKDNMEAEYNRGLNDAWEVAKKIHDCQIPYEVFGLDKTGNGFSYASPLNWGETITAQEAISKIKEYEEQQKQDAEQKQDAIKVWDEVYSEMNDLRFIVTRIITSKHMDITVKRYEGICTDGAAYCPLPNDICKTGRTFPQIAEVLEKMRGESE